MRHGQRSEAEVMAVTFEEKKLALAEIIKASMLTVSEYGGRNSRDANQLDLVT